MKTILQTQGYAAPRAGAELEPFAFTRRDLRDDDVDIDIHFCGICHSDIHQARDEWGGAIYPMVPGHEIAGVVTAVGSGVSKFQPGDRVGVGCLVDSCGTCDSCRRGLEQYCLKGSVPTYNGIDKDGNPTYGGYSQRIVVNEDFVLRIPDALPLDAAAPLLCAGITTYSPLRHWQAGPGKKVAIVGMGGLGHVGVKIARAMGAHVTVLSQTLSKQTDGERFGAHAYHATSDPSTFERLAGQFDLIINTVSAQLDWNAYLSLLRVDGALVVVGAPPDPAPVNAFNLIAGRHTLAGSGIGGIRETQEMLDFCAERGIAADIERIRIQDVNEAFERVLKSDVRYRFVIEIDSLHGNCVEA